MSDHDMIRVRRDDVDTLTNTTKNFGFVQWSGAWNRLRDAAKEGQSAPLDGRCFDARELAEIIAYVRESKEIISGALGLEAAADSRIVDIINMLEGS